MTQKRVDAVVVNRQKSAAEQLAEAVKNLKIWPEKDYKGKNQRAESQRKGILESKDSEVQESKNADSEVQKKLKTSNTSRKWRYFKPRGRGGYPMKVKSDFLDKATQTEGRQWRDCSVFVNPRPMVDLIDPKLRHLPLYWGVPRRFFDPALFAKPQPLMGENWDYRKPKEANVYFFNPPAVVSRTPSHQTDLRHIWLREHRKWHSELVIDVNSARRYLDSKPSKTQAIGKTIYDFNEWRRAQNADDHQLHGWISSNLIDMDPHEFLTRIDGDGGMRGRYSTQALRRMQNWTAMHSSWRDEFLIYPVILFIREEKK